MKTEGSARGGMTAFQKRRRELAGELHAARVRAGFTQSELAQKIDYAMVKVVNAEKGQAVVNLEFWERCDELLGTGGLLADKFIAVRSRQRDRKINRKHKRNQSEIRRSSERPD